MRRSGRIRAGSSYLLEFPDVPPATGTFDRSTAVYFDCRWVGIVRVVTIWGGLRMKILAQGRRNMPIDKFARTQHPRILTPLPWWSSPSPRLFHLCPEIPIAN